MNSRKPAPLSTSGPPRRAWALPKRPNRIVSVPFSPGDHRRAPGRWSLLRRGAGRRNILVQASPRRQERHRQPLLALEHCGRQPLTHSRTLPSDSSRHQCMLPAQSHRDPSNETPLSGEEEDTVTTPRPSLAIAVAFALTVALGPPAVGSAAAAPEGQLTLAGTVTIAPTWFEPAETPGVITPFLTLYALHDALVKPMPGNAWAPCLAESWTASKDGLTYEFVLRKGVRFHNGDPVTAEDVKFSFERYKGGGASTLQARVAAVEVVDSQRVRFRMKQPWPDFMTFYGTPATSAAWIVPKKYVERVGDDGFKRAPVGAGPYRFVSFNPGVELALEAYDGYWRKTPSVKRVVLKSVPDEATRAVMVRRGESDISYGLRGPDADDVRRTP